MGKTDIAKFWKKQNWDGFCLTANPNDVPAHFLKIVNKLLNNYAPYITIRYSKPQYGTKPWIIPGLANSIRNKNKLYKRFCKEKNLKTKEYYENFFTSVAKKINKNIVKPKQTHLSYLGRENNNTIFLSPTLPEDIEDLISSMKTNKASGPNSIPTKILKLFKK